MTRFEWISPCPSSMSLARRSFSKSTHIIPFFWGVSSILLYWLMIILKFHFKSKNIQNHVFMHHLISTFDREKVKNLKIMHLVSSFWRWVIFCFVEKDSCLMVVFYLICLQYGKYIWSKEQVEEYWGPRLRSWSLVSNKWWSMKKWWSLEVIWRCHGVINSWKCPEGDHEGVLRRR